MKQIKIYSLIDPISEEIRYIGQTYRDLNVRLKEHVYDCIRRPRSSHKVNWINSLISKNLYPKIILLEIVDSSLLQEREKYWIIKMKSDGYKLCNGTDGGEFCTSGSNLSDDIRKHLSDKAKARSLGENNNMWGKKHNKSSKKKMSRKKIGIYDGVNNPRAKKLYQYDLNNNLIKVWEYAKECADFYNISRGNISTFAKHNSNCENKFRILKGFIFKFN